MNQLLYEEEFLSVILVGLIAGFMQELSKPKGSPHFWIKTILTTSFIVASIFLMLDMSGLSYSVKLGISSMFGFLGLEKGLNYIREFLSYFKKG